MSKSRSRKHHSFVVIPDDMIIPCREEPNFTESNESDKMNVYSCEWKKFMERDDYLPALKRSALEGDLRTCRFRSLCWKLFLDVLPEDKNRWITTTRENRKWYEATKNVNVINPRYENRIEDVMLNNPLSQYNESSWNKYFEDNELRILIKQDVIRTFPEVEFFKNDLVREIMMNVLFLFCRLNVSLSYQQGMHELLAPLIFVLHCDHEAFLHAAEVEDISDELKELMDPTYLEHDAYFLFCKVMETVEPWYHSNDSSSPRMSRHSVFTYEPFAQAPDVKPTTAISLKLIRIQEQLLKKHDFELYNHLERMDIPPQIYGIRWIRLLFGREFPLHDLLALWDALFSEGAGFKLIDYIFISMLLYIRDLLLASSYANCLSAFMHYPPATDVQFFVQKSLWLREPQLHPQPPNYSYHTLNSGASNLTEVPLPFGYKWSTDVLRSQSAAASPSADQSVFSPASVVSTPDASHSPHFYKTSKLNKLVKELSTHNRLLVDQLKQVSRMRQYCSKQLEDNVNKLQSMFLNDTKKNEDELFLALAGIKQVRDILNETLTFTSDIYEDVRDNEEGNSQNGGDAVDHQNIFKTQTVERIRKKGFQKLFSGGAQKKSSDDKRLKSTFYEVNENPVKPVVLLPGHTYELQNKNSNNGSKAEKDDLILEFQPSFNSVYRP